MAKKTFITVSPNEMAARKSAFNTSKTLLIQATKNSAFYLPRTGIGGASEKEFDNIDSEFDTSDIKSYLNTPVFSSIQFGESEELTGRKNAYTDLEGFVIEYDALRIDTAIVTVSQQKIIEKTTLQGRVGTVKEYSSTSDFQISASLILSSNTNRYPKEDLSKMIKIINVPEQIKVTNELLNSLSISYIVIESANIIQERGKRNEQLIELTLISDDAPENIS